MFRKRKAKPDPSPHECALQKVTFIETEKTVPVVKSIPDKTSEAYQKTLQRSYGSFNRIMYTQLGGTWSEKEELISKTIYSAAFTCRRAETDGLNVMPYNYTHDTETRVKNVLLHTIEGLGWCATCPYVGMDRIQADKYDATSQQAEADRLNAELNLAKARQELDAFLSPSLDQVD